MSLNPLPGRLSLLSVAAAVLAATTIALSAQIAPLHLVSTAWSPFTNDAGKPRFATDLVDTALGRIGITARTTIVEPAAFTPALLSAAYDGSAAAWKDPERERLLVFSQPYLENRLVLVGRKGADVSATSWAALKGKKVALVGGYAYGDIEGAGPTFVKTKGEEDSLTQLLRGQTDYALMDDLVVQYLLDNYAKEAQTRLQLGSKPLITRPLYLAIRQSRPDAESIVSRFNEQLRGMIKDRTYHKLLHVDWIVADVDGDGIPEYVPASDQAGKTAPEHAYSLSTTAPSTAGPRFFLGGTIYTDWASVPDNYKIMGSQTPDPRRSTASVFKFVW
ncbi:MAG TPA: transporter substrate-binding domain-containing protein [Vicinamibacterales bacterium]|nr:transporter substrate-binding domain-containing protein [Vicinamibacterales bacterium]